MDWLMPFLMGIAMGTLVCILVLFISMSKPPRSDWPDKTDTERYND